MHFSAKSASWPLATILLTVGLAACGQIEKESKQIIGQGKPGNPGGPGEKGPPQAPPIGRPGMGCGLTNADSMNLLCTLVPADRLYTHKLNFGNQAAYSQSAVELEPDSCTALVLNLTSGAVAEGSATPAKLDVDLTIELKSSVATGGFFGDSACSNAIAAIDLPKGKTQTDVLYFKDPQMRSGTLYGVNLTATPQLKTENPAVRIGPASLAGRVKYTPPPPPPGPQAVRFAKAPGGETIKTGQCQPLAVHLADETNAAGGATTPKANNGEEFQIVLSSGSLTGSFYRDASCTEQVNIVSFPAGAVKAADFYYRDYSAGQKSIAARPRSSQLPFALGDAAALTVTVTP